MTFLAGLENLNITGSIVRKEAKTHGMSGRLAGPTITFGTEVVVLEDVTTTGASALEAVQVIRSVGGQVNHVLSLLDRQEGAVDVLKERDLKLRSLYTLDDITC